MAKNIRSEYLQQLIEDKNSLESKLKEVTKSTIESIMGENIENKLRKIISEDEDSFIEDEVEDDSIDSSEDKNDETEVVSDEETSVDTSDEDGETEGTETADVVDGTDGEETENDDIWNDLEQYRGADGEYDLTGMDADNLIKVMQVMKPSDGIRVVKNDNGTITLNDDETEKEYIIDIEGENVENTEDSVSDEGVEEGKQRECNEETNLGYTDNFQNKTAMTTPPNTEPANPKTTYSMDGGAPTGTEKRWANQGDKAPYDESVNEECEFELELDDDCKDKDCRKEDEKIDETMTTQEQGPYNRGTGMVHTNTNAKAAKGRNAHAGGEQISGTADNSYSKTQLENIMRKANAIFRENKELKALVPKMQQQMMESIVINKSMGNVMRIVMENSTSINEKKEILKRFTGVKTIEESDNLYKTISEELKREGKTMNVNNVINAQLAESKNSVVETPMYQSEDLAKTLNLISRLNKIK